MIREFGLRLCSTLQPRYLLGGAPKVVMRAERCIEVNFEDHDHYSAEMAVAPSHSTSCSQFQNTLVVELRFFTAKEQPFLAQTIDLTLLTRAVANHNQCSWLGRRGTVIVLQQTKELLHKMRYHKVRPLPSKHTTVFQTHPQGLQLLSRPFPGLSPHPSCSSPRPYLKNSQMPLASPLLQPALLWLQVSPLTLPSESSRAVQSRAENVCQQCSQQAAERKSPVDRDNAG